MVGFVTAGPSRDSGANRMVAELYVYDIDVGAAGESGAGALLEHACRDLSRHGFAEVFAWFGARDERLRGVLHATGWTLDKARRIERIHGIPVSQVRYRKALALAQAWHKSC